MTDQTMPSTCTLSPPGELSRPNELCEAIRPVVDEVQRLLTTRSKPLDLVAWLSAHLAAMDHAVYPVARRALDDGTARVVELRRLALNVLSVARMVERHHTGDFLVSEARPIRLHDELESGWAAYRECERPLVDRLADQLPAAELRARATAYDDGLRHAPTRPHPHLTHAGPLAPVVYLAERVRDKLLDTMDGRHVPVPRQPRRYVRPGRWGSYFLGQPVNGSEEE